MMILPNPVYDIRLSHDTVEYKPREGSRRPTIKSQIYLQEVHTIMWYKSDAYHLNKNRFVHNFVAS